MVFYVPMDEYLSRCVIDFSGEARISLESKMSD